MDEFHLTLFSDMIFSPMLMETILVSVIVPIYKAENTIHKCIDSIVNQTHHNIEIILINDGSPDNCGQIMDDYARVDHRVKVIHQQNSGVAAARNAGLRQAQGDYITFVDADDWIDLNFIFILLSSNKRADIIRCKFRYEYSNGRSDTDIEMNSFEDGLYILQADFKYYIYSKMLEGIELNAIWRTLFKREVLADIYFDENIETAEDLLFCMNAYTKARDFSFIALPLYHYFVNPQGLTGSGLSKITKLKCNLIISNYLVSYLSIWNIRSLNNILRSYARIINIVIFKANKISINKKNT